MNATAVADPVRGFFLEEMEEEAKAVNLASDIVRLMPRPGARAPADIYDGMFDGVQHFEQLADGVVTRSTAPIDFSISFPTNYLKSGDPRLQFQVARVLTPMLHPNVARGIVCLGARFAPGTGLRALVEHLYAIFSGQVFATDHAFDAAARDYFLSHLDDVKALMAKPLWRRKLAGRIRVEQLDATPLTPKSPPASGR